MRITDKTQAAKVPFASLAEGDWFRHDDGEALMKIYRLDLVDNEQANAMNSEGGTFEIGVDDEVAPLDAELVIHGVKAAK